MNLVLLQNWLDNGSFAVLFLTMLIYWIGAAFPELRFLPTLGTAGMAIARRRRRLSRPSRDSFISLTRREDASPNKALDDFRDSTSLSPAPHGFMTIASVDVRI